MRLLLLLLAGLALLGTYVALASRSPERDELLSVLVLQLAAGLLYLAAAGVALGFKEQERRGRPYVAIIAFAVAFRAALVLAPPLLSTDLHRYEWEGRVQRALENPYRLAPDAPELARLRDANWEHVEHREVPAIYGPLAEASFFLLGTPLAMKIFFAFADLVACGLVSRALARRGLPSTLVLLYAWHPLPIVEVAGQGHVDALGVALLLLGVRFMTERDAGSPGTKEGAETRSSFLGSWVPGTFFSGRGRAAVALGLAAAVKFLPLVVLPAFARRAGVRATLLALALFLVSFAPYGLPHGLGPYATEWRFNATGIVAIEAALEATGVQHPIALALARGDEQLANDTPRDKAPQRIIAALLVLAIALALSRAALEKAAFGSIAAVLALSPVVHPWYLLWILPFAVLRRSLAWLTLGLTAPITYSVLLAYSGTRESWHEEAWPRLLVLIPFAVLLVWENVPHGKRVPATP